MATYTISGFVLDSLGAAISGVAVATSVGSSTTDATGAFSISGHADGSYTLTPTKTGYTFAPSSRAETVSGANITGQNFIGSTSTYGSDAGVESLNKDRNYDTGTITRTDLARFRDLIETEMNARFASAGYSTPITTANALKICAMISNLGVAASAEDAQFMGSIAPDETTHAQVLWRQYRELMDRYAGVNGGSPAVILPGATRTTPTSRSLDYPKVVPTYTNEEEDSYQIFKVDTAATYQEIP